MHLGCGGPRPAYCGNVSGQTICYRPQEGEKPFLLHRGEVSRASPDVHFSSRGVSVGSEGRFFIFDPKRHGGIEGRS